MLVINNSLVIPVDNQLVKILWVLIDLYQMPHHKISIITAIFINEAWEWKCLRNSAWFNCY